MTENKLVKSETLITMERLSYDRECHCWRCGYEWISRKRPGSTPPAVCPRCGRKDWSHYRLFTCSHCGHEFSSGKLGTNPYSLFPKCPSCETEHWHIGVERRKAQQLEQLEKQARERLLAERQRRRLSEKKAEVYIKKVRTTIPGGCRFLIWLEIIVAIFMLSALILLGISEGNLSELWRDASDLLCGSSGTIILMLLLLLRLKRRNRKTMIKRLDKLIMTGQISVEERRIIEEQLKLRRAK